MRQGTQFYRWWCNDETGGGAEGEALSAEEVNQCRERSRVGGDAAIELGTVARKKRLADGDAERTNLEVKGSNAVTKMLASRMVEHAEKLPASRT